jgi:UDPglucose 6-dehydrogenase
MTARVAVIGCGHVGLVVAAGLAKLGHAVIGVDREQSRIDSLCNGEVEFHEPGLSDLLAEGLKSGRLSFTTSYDFAIPQSEFVFLAVDTPATPGGAADLGNIRAATHSIAASLNGTSPIIVNKSTSPIGTGETIEELLSRAIEARERVPRIVSNPEFLRQGRVVHDFFAPDRIVVGSHRRDDAEAVAGLYDGIDAPVIVTDLRTAEMIKYVSNSFLATKISFINEISRLCEQLGVEIDDVVDGISLDPRIGRDFLTPGIGFGGSCLPKDIAALRYVGETLGVSTPLLTAVQGINQAQRTNAVRRIRARLGGLEGRTIAVWGVTFKGGTEDVRDSPAVDVIELLLNEGATLQAYDPTFPKARPPQLAQAYRANPIEAARGADALAVLTEWDEFRTVSLPAVRAVMRGNVLFDGRNIVDREAAEAAGFAYMGIGRRFTDHRRRVTD